MSGINRQPTGWLGFLGIKNFGRNPAVTVDALAPTWDLSDLYENAGAVHAERAYPLALNAGVNILFQPGNQTVWRVQAFSAYLETGGAATVQATLARVAQDGLLSVFLTPPQTLAINSRGALALEREILLLPGEALSLSVLALTGAPVGAAQVRYTPLQA